MTLVAQGLAKAFGAEQALAGVDLEVADGEIHALLGPNGSGKSTLIGCLSGRLAPDAGSITIGERTVRRFSPRAAAAAGTAVIYQHFSLVPPLSVVDNIFLGSERTGLGGALDRSSELAEADELLTRLGARVDPRAPVSSLSVGQQQLVEIAKAMRHRPRLLVLDEPTAALGEAEARILGRQLRGLRDEGLAILYVTHLLSEVFEIADRVTVLRDGRTVLNATIGTLSPREVIGAIAPRHGAAAVDPRAGGAQRAEHAERVLELDGFVAPGVGPIDLSVDAGEAVAVFGLLGSGRSELLEGLYGIRGRTGGRVTLAGDAFAPRSAAASLARGLALVPADRGRQGVFASMSALDNVLVPHFRRLGWPWWRRRGRERNCFADTARFLRLKPADPRAPAWTYSGGNQQKLVVGRWLAEQSEARVLLLDEPTQGIDVGARADLYDLARQFVARPGRGVLFSSSDPEEVQALADRALVLARGRIVAQLERDEITPDALLALAHGAPPQPSPTED
ncbi:MAG TPA: sugar ABC transporter ATP-binding protein [Conexibacter sp.]